MKSLSIVIPFFNNLERCIKICEQLKNVSFNGVVQYLFMSDGSDADMVMEFRKYLKENNLHNMYNINERFLNKGVNFTWNEGIELAKCMRVLVINNDIDITLEVIEAMYDALDNEKNYIACPIELVNGEENKRTNPINGACWMIRKKDREEIGPIPSGLMSFYGDDWLYNKITKTLGKKMARINIPIVHHLCKTTRKIENIDDISKDDADVYKLILKKYGWEDSRFSNKKSKGEQK